MDGASATPSATGGPVNDDRTYFDHLQNAVMFLRLGDSEAALDECNKAAVIHNDGPEALCVLGLVVFQMGDAGRAISLLERAHDHDPDCSDYANALAVMYGKLGKIADGLYYGKLAVALKPHPRLTDIIPAEFRDYSSALETAAPSPHYVNAFARYLTRKFEEAAELCQRELRINERHAPCYHLLGRAMAELGLHDQAVDAYHASIHIEPDNAAAMIDLGTSLLHLGRFDEARACHQRALTMASGEVDVHARAMAMAGHFADTGGPDMAARGRALRENGLGGVEPVDRTLFASGAERTKIRVGYISDEFHGAPDIHFAEAVLKSHDRSCFEIYGYQQNAHSDLSTTRFKSYADQWREIYDIDDETAAMIIAGDGVDILVDLCRYSGSQRLGLLARRPAPIQVSWLSWPNGAGSGVFDYVLGDAVTATADEPAATGETLLETGAGLMAFDAESVTLDASRLAASPVAETEVVTFGGIGDMARVTSAVAETWSRILNAVPGSRVLLGNVSTLCPASRARAQELFSHFGVVDRIAFQDDTPEDVVNLQFLSQVDVLLDTFPVSGTTDICEALVMGVPVVTLAGKSRTGRTGASILRAAGRGDWVAATTDAYVEVAARVGGDRDGLVEMRKSLGEAVAKSALCDREGFTRALEKTYQRMRARPAAKTAKTARAKPKATTKAKATTKTKAEPKKMTSPKKKPPAKKAAAAKPKAGVNPRRKAAGQP